MVLFVLLFVVRKDKLVGAEYFICENVHTSRHMYGVGVAKMQYLPLKDELFEQWTDIL